MITPNTILNNPYYFIKNNTLFKISYSKDGDNDCAVHKVTYETEAKQLKKGDKYRDLHGDEQKAEADGTYQVKTKKTDDTECAKVFPYFTVNYTKDGDTKTVYYYLQNLITDGDTLSGNKFVKTLHGDTIPSGSTLDGYAYILYKEMVNEVKSLIEGGKTIKQIKEIMPHWCFASLNKDYIDIYGYKYVPSSVSRFTPLTDEQLNGLVVESVNESVKKYANSLLSKHSKKVKSGQELVTSDKIENK